MQLNLTEPKFQGCIIAPQMLSTIAQLPIKDDGTCSAVLGDMCLSEIKNRISRASIGSENPCGDIQTAIGLSSEAKNSNCTATQWSTLFGQPIFPNESNCTIPGSTDSGNVVASFGESVSPSPADDFSLYDSSIGIARPYIVAVWEKTDGNGGSTSVTLESKVVCIPTDNIVKGSRTLPDAPTSTNRGAPTSTKTENIAAGRAHGTNSGLSAVIGLSVLLAVAVEVLYSARGES